VKLAILTKFVLRGSLREEMANRLKGQGFDNTDFVWMGVAPSSYDGDFSKSDLKEFREAWNANISTHDVDAVLSMGNESLFVSTGHSGIMKWRGEVCHDGHLPIMPTIALGAVERNPSQIQLLYADLRALYRVVHGAGRDALARPPRIRVITDEGKLEEFQAACKTASAVAFDLETKSFNEFEEDSFIICAAYTLCHTDDSMSCWVVPLSHPKSPCKSNWTSILRRISHMVKNVPVRVAHNSKFDCRWLVHFGAPVPCTFDTLLAAHLLDENRFKGLKPLAQMLLDAAPWSINTTSGKNALPWYTQHTLRDILRYCAVDTWHTMRLYRLLEKELRKDRRLYDLFTKLIMPASQSLVHVERHGVYVHQDALLEGARIVSKELKRIHRELMSYVPEEVNESDVNFNPSNFLRWFLYDHLAFPVLKEGKIGPSVAESILTQLADIHPHPVLSLLVDRVKWQKWQSSFFNPYQELITNDSRLRTTFKLHGTVTGRLSSGKADSDKVTGSKASSIRGVNLQQVPRDPLVRGIFGAPRGWSFVEADYSQIELRIAAEISGEPTLRALYQRGEDVHMAMAVRMTGKPPDQITKEERKKAKAVNFGFLYGMGARKFMQTAWDNYGIKVTLDEAEAARTAFFQQFPELLRWHAQQRRLAHKYHRVQSPIGRIRHLPDILSRDKGVVGEAERQAINSPVQAMASDLCLLALVLLHRKFVKGGFRAIPIGTVHDAINFEVPNDELPLVLPIIKKTMERPPLRELFGYELSVPIVADIGVGRAWGKCNEVPVHLFRRPALLKEWLNVPF
jgi:DNA polymerase-1